MASTFFVASFYSLVIIIANNYSFTRSTIILALMKGLVFVTILLLSSQVKAQYKVSTLDIGAEVTALCNSVDGRLIYGTEQGVVGFYDGLKPSSEVSFDAVVHTLGMSSNSEEVLCGTGAGLYIFGPSQKNITGSHLQVLALMGNSNLVVCKEGIYQKEGAVYREANLDGLPKWNTIQKAKYAQIGSKAYLQVDTKLFVKDKWWKLKSDSIIDMASNSKEVLYLRKDGLYSQEGNVIQYMDCDSTAQLFLNGEGRVFITNDNFISEVLDQGVRPIYTINTAEIQCITEDSWHNIWLSANRYLYRVVLEENPSLPQLRIERINDKPASAKVTLDKGKQDLVVTYKGVQLTKPQLLAYQSRMEGMTDWLPATNEESVRFSNMSPGNYSYQLRATIDGKNFTYTEPVQVQVADGLLSKVFLIMLLVGLGILVTAMIGNYRLNAYKRKIASERQRLLDQNRLLALEQKALQLQMNPHFIFNALNSIKGLIAQGESKQARQSLTDFAHLMRATLDMSRKDTVTLHQEVDYLKQYMELESWVMQGGFSYSVEVEPGTDTDLELPTMLVQPFVENAIKHAFNGKKGKGRIAVRFAAEGGYLTVYIEDNGVGILGSTAHQDHKSVAMTVVKDRLSLKYPKSKGPLIDVRSPMDSNGGTAITLRIPIRGN